ncbi:unnamed protein product [Triticum turgidum subsp. durum]|uniref:Protein DETOXIFICATION n=1 Tax=Triticum turgidum subsp. durum TaxID=4567 RepID=A0A9R0UZE9_TRITD|nr:unnamed protein product [Triticum turgidum subsp. durum]
MDLLGVFFHGATLAFERDDLGREIMGIAVPGALALMADPLASLVDTAFIGRIGPVEIAAVGVSIVVFNQVTRIAVFPLVSVTTSFVAEEDATSSDRNKDEISGENEHNVSEMDELITHEENNATSSKSSFETDSSEINTEHKRKKIPSVSTALLLGGVLGLVETLLLVSCAKPILDFMGVKAYGVSGAAVAHVISQYFIAAILVCRLRLQVELLPPNLKHLPIGRFLKNGSLLLARVIAATCCVTLSASMAARLGPTQMAAFQICLQIWLASSLLADGLAFAGQAILASAFARKDHSKAKATASRLLQLGLILGLLLGLLLGVGLHTGSRLFTEDQGVLHHIYVAIPFVALTQPINALAFVFDGVNYGASDFAYAAYSLILVAIVSIAFIVTLANYSGFIGIWIALSIYMCLRMFAGLWRIGTARGPWAFLRS